METNKPEPEETEETDVKWLLILVSPGHCFALTFKNKISKFSKNKKSDRKKFITKNNTGNLIISGVLLALIIFSHSSIKDSEFHKYLCTVCAWRYLSRCVEITFAFGLDVCAINQQKKQSSLHKHERITLAIRSYFEIFIYSASLYLAFFPNYEIVNAVIASLSVGTLTNVAYSFQKNPSWFDILVFGQVFTTLSLVVLSLAIYISGKDDDSAPQNPRS